MSLKLILTHRNIRLAKHVWYAVPIVNVALVLRIHYHSCYSSRGRRLYSCNEHDSSRIMSSSRVGFLTIAWGTFPQHHYIEILNPYGRSAIHFKRRSSSIVRLSCHSYNKAQEKKEKLTHEFLPHHSIKLQGTRIL
jgi:hypothetical protein